MYQSTFRSSGTASADARAMEAAMIAHDIRAALQGVVGGVAAIERANFPSALARQVDGIVASSRLLESLIGLAVGDKFDPEPDHDKVVLRELFDLLAYRWTGEAQARGSKFEIEADPGLPDSVHLQHVALTRLLGNLLSNAIEHSGSSLITLQAERSDKGDLVLRVRDTGRGFSVDVLESHRARTGLDAPLTDAVHGLGLHIVQRLASEMGATVRLSNLSSGGGEASVSIPLCLLIDREERDSRATADAPEGAPQERSADLAGLSVLLAEDNPTNQMVAEQMLRGLGADVVVAADGVEALERFEARPFDMVVVDIEMPRLSGLDVIRSIRARKDGRSHTPIVALTAYALREHRDRIAEAGANGMISKPITSIEVLGRGLSEHRPCNVPQSRHDTVPEATDFGSDLSPAVDREIYEALLAAIGVEMTGELLEKVEADIESARAELAAGIDPVATGPLRAASHILISVAGAVGATRLQASARTLNAAAHSDGGPDLAEQARACIAEIDTAIDFVRAERSRL